MTENSKVTRKVGLVTVMVGSLLLLGAGCLQAVDVGSDLQQPVSNVDQNDAGRVGWLDGGIIVPCGPECSPEDGGSPACAGDLVIGTQQQWDDFVARGCLHFSGSLSIRADGPISALTNDVLQTLSGDLRIVANPTTVSLPALITVGGTLDIALNARLTDVNLPMLQSLGSLNLLASAALTRLDLPSLRTIRTVATIQNNGLRTLNLPALEMIRGNGLSIWNNPALTSLTLPSLTAPGFNFAVRDNAALTSLSLPALTASESIGVGGNAALTTLEAPLLATVNGNLLIVQNGALTSLSLPSLSSVTQNLDVSSNTQLRQCVVDALRAQLTTAPAMFSASGNEGAPNACP